MATAHTPHPIRGKVGNLIYRVRDGRQTVHFALGPSQEEKLYKRRLKYRHFRLNLQEFAAASSVASDIYRALFQTYRHLLRPYAHNQLTARLKRAADHHVKFAPDGPRYHYGTGISLYDAWKALSGLDLSHKGAPAAAISITPTGPQHNPDALRIAGLREAARSIPVHGNAQLEVRIHVRQMDFMEKVGSYDLGQWRSRNPKPLSETVRDGSDAIPTAWIPVEALPPEGIRIALPPAQEGDRFLTGVIVEWREVRAVDGKIVHHPLQAVARVASVHGTPEDFIQRPNPYPTPATCPGFPQPPAINWRQDPRAYVEEAILQLRT